MYFFRKVTMEAHVVCLFVYKYIPGVWYYVCYLVPERWAQIYVVSNIFLTQSCFIWLIETGTRCLHILGYFIAKILITLRASYPYMLLMRHMWDCELANIFLRKWLDACLVPSHYLMQWWIIVDLSPPSTTYMHQWIGSALVQVMACCLFGAKPLPEPMLAYCQLDSWE